MGDKLTAHFDADQITALEAMQEAGDADSMSEAIRVAATTGLQELGYQDGDNSSAPSGLAVAGESVGWVAGVFALSWLGVTIAYPVELRIPAVAALCASLAAFGVARLAGGAGVGVRARLFGGESA